MKIVGALIIVFSALVIAFELSCRVERTARTVSSLRALLEYTKNMIDCYALPSSEILRRIDAGLLFDCGYKQKNPPRDFNELVGSLDIADLEARELLYSFAKDFGKSYRADELSRCALYLEKMRSREQKLIKESAKKKKMIFTVAVCSSLAVIILIV